MKCVKSAIVAVLFLFLSAVLEVQAGGVVPPKPAKPPTPQQEELEAAEDKLRDAKRGLLAAKEEHAETIAEYANLKRGHVLAVKSRRKAEERFLVFSDEILIAPYDTGVVTKSTKTTVPDPGVLDPTDPAAIAATTTTVTTAITIPATAVRSKLREAQEELETAKANLIPDAGDPISIAKLNPTAKEAKLISAYNKAKEKWDSVKRYAQRLRMLVAKGPVEKNEPDEYAHWRYKLEAPDNWEPEMVLAEIYRDAVEHEKRVTTEIEELQEAYDIAIQAIKAAEEKVRSCEGARNQLLEVIEIQGIKTEIQDGLKGVKVSIDEVKVSIDSLAGKFDTLTETIAASSTGSETQARILTEMLNKIEALQQRNALTEQALAKLEAARQLMTCAQPGQVAYTICRRGGRWCYQ